MLAFAFLLAGLTSAQAHLYLYQAPLYIVANDIGGMISWTPESERVAFAVSAAHCAYFGKVARITSIYRQYGNYIGFSCAFPRGYVVRQRNIVIRTKG
jgi:hypothetical protein